MNLNFKKNKNNFGRATSWKRVAILFCMACFAINSQVVVGQVKVEYDSENSEITINNRTDQNIVLIRDDISKNAEVKSAFDISIVKRMEPAGIALPDFFVVIRSKKLASYQNISAKPAKIVYYTFREVNEMFLLLEKREVLAKDFTEPIKEEPAPKIEEPKKQEENLAHVVETPPEPVVTTPQPPKTQTPAPSAPKAETKTKAKTSSPKPAALKNPNREKIDKWVNESKSLLSKKKDKITPEDKITLKNIEKNVIVLQNVIENERDELEEQKANTKVKCTDCDVLIKFATASITELDFLLAKIHKILASLTDEEIEDMKKEYREVVLNSFSQDAFDIQHIKNEIEKRSNTSLLGWIGLSKVKGKLNDINRNFRLINEKSDFFIAQKLAIHTDDYDRAVIGDLNKEIPVTQKEISECERDLNLIEIPYVKLAMIGVVVLLLIAGVAFYLRTVFMNKKNKRIEMEKKEAGETGLLIEEDFEVETISYHVGLKDIKEKSGVEYYKVDMDTIFDDTTLRDVYLSKKAILDIYKFFSAFLRYEDKTNETGCFLVGRWDYVPDSNNQRYDISIESVVEPSDDAVYGEYALNFGAKIGITLNFKIEKLCEKTGNEYVHTAWMHSHPGLGLFLSSQDLSVQSQLAHSQHFGRMLAIVLDSNSPDFQTAFFAPKLSGAMNNDKDVKKLISFEELYKWTKRAVVQEPPPPPPPQTPAAPAPPQNHYSMEVTSTKDTVNKIYLSAPAIIDMDMAIMPDATGLQGYISGELIDKMLIFNDFEESVDENGKTENTVACFLVVPHFNPEETLKNNDYLKFISDFNFLVFYALDDEKLNILSKDELLASPSLSEMKEWTRRKR